MLGGLLATRDVEARVAIKVRSYQIAVLQSLQLLYISPHIAQLGSSEGFDHCLSSFTLANLILYPEKVFFSSPALIHAASPLSHLICSKAERVKRFSTFVISCDTLFSTICETVDFIVGGQHHLLTQVSEQLRLIESLPTSKNANKKSSLSCSLCYWKTNLV